jgi:hypothetical protein
MPQNCRRDTLLPPILKNKLEYEITDKYDNSLLFQKFTLNKLTYSANFNHNLIISISIENSFNRFSFKLK